MCTRVGAGKGAWDTQQKKINQMTKIYDETRIKKILVDIMHHGDIIIILLVAVSVEDVWWEIKLNSTVGRNNGTKAINIRFHSFSLFSHSHSSPSFSNKYIYFKSI